MATETATTTRAGQAFEGFPRRPARRSRLQGRLRESIAEVLRVIEEVREREKIPKAEIARRMDRKPEAISRLLRGEGSNPTLDTLIDLVDAVGLELDIRIKRQPAKRNGDYSPLKIQAAV